MSQADTAAHSDFYAWHHTCNAAASRRDDVGHPLQAIARPDDRASLQTGISAQVVDTTFASLQSPARRLATAINPTPPASFRPNATKLNVARTAAIESFSRVSGFDDLTHDESSKSLQSAFDLAWDDFSRNCIRRGACKANN